MQPDIRIPAATLQLALSPQGHFHLIQTAGQEVLTQVIVARITRAFAQGASHGLLHLAAVELTSSLPPSLAFGRELARLFMTRLCAVPDLAENYATADLACPDDELRSLIAAIPPMVGAEYISLPQLAETWRGLQAAARAELMADNGDVQAWRQRLHPHWRLMGRVCFHLAENKGNESHPFAFIATYGTTVTQHAQVQHQPLGRALQEYAHNREQLLSLLLPVSNAAGESPWLRSLVDSGAIFHPIAWTPSEAHHFLRDEPLWGSHGIAVRIPDWWKPRQPPRPQVKVKLGSSLSGIGFDGLLDFSLTLSLGDDELSPEEWETLRQAGDGLVRLKGRWVEVDQEKLNGVLTHWKKVQRNAARNGLSFIEGMRLLAGVTTEDPGHRPGMSDTENWSTVVAGQGLQEVLDNLRNPQEDLLPPANLNATLRPYQLDGVRWLWLLSRLGLGGCLADDMGLGKTIQVLTLFLLARQHNDPGPHLLVLPASLIGNWQAELTRFAPALSVLVAHPSVIPVRKLATLPINELEQADVVITSYGNLSRLPQLQNMTWSMVVLDEAQAIKNPGAQQTQAAKALKSRVRFALTGTPVENSLGDLWSLFDFICPGLLGSEVSFRRFVRQLERNEHVSYAPLRDLVSPYILRRLKQDKRIIADLPDKTEVRTYCALSRLQARLYEQAVDYLTVQLDTADGMTRKGLILAFMMRFKQICNHPDQWLGQGPYTPGDSGKFTRLRELTEAIAARQEKVLVFTQFREMTTPLAAFLQTVFGRPGLVLHGGTPVKSRQSLVNQFQDEQGPPFFVLSIKAGGTGLNLTAASHVIHFDRWWNPAVENQATDRAYRIGQQRNVLVHKFICQGTVEEKIDTLIENKLALADDILAEGGEMRLTEMSNEALLKLVSLDISCALAETGGSGDDSHILDS